jgi:hypothetical protein
MARLASIPADQLDDDRLLVLYRRARRGLITEALEAASLAIVARPNLFDNRPGEAVSVYSDLASLAAARGEMDRAMTWLARGRQADSGSPPPGPTSGTPGGPASGSGGALWTPGSASGNQPAGGKPGLIIRGR